MWHPDVGLGVSYVPLDSYALHQTASYSITKHHTSRYLPCAHLSPIVSITGQCDPRCLRLVGAVNACAAALGGDKEYAATLAASKL